MATINPIDVRPIQLDPHAADLYAEVDRLTNLIRQKRFEDQGLVRPAGDLPALKELLRGENGSDPITKLFYATCILEQSPDDEEALGARFGSRYRYWPEQGRDFARLSERPSCHTRVSPLFLAEMHASKCDFQNSLATLNTCLTSIKSNERYLYLLRRSLTYFTFDRRDESLKDFKEAADCSPWQEPLRQAIKDGNFSEAIKHLDGVAGFGPHLCLLLFGDDTLRARLLPHIKREMLPNIFKYIALYKKAPENEQAFLLFLRGELLQQLASIAARRAADDVARGTKRPAEAVVPPPAQRIETETPLSRLQALEGEFRSGCTLERANAMLPLVEAIAHGELFVRCTELKMRLLMHCNKYKEARLLAGPILGQDIDDTVRQRVYKMLQDIAVLLEKPS